MRIEHIPNPQETEADVITYLTLRLPGKQRRDIKIPFTSRRLHPGEVIHFGPRYHNPNTLIRNYPLSYTAHITYNHSLQIQQFGRPIESVSLPARVDFWTHDPVTRHFVNRGSLQRRA